MVTNEILIIVKWAPKHLYTIFLNCLKTHEINQQNEIKVNCPLLLCLSKFVSLAVGLPYLRTFGAINYACTNLFLSVLRCL